MMKNKLKFLLLFLLMFLLVGCLDNGENKDQTIENLMDETFFEIFENVNTENITEDVSLPLEKNDISIVWYSHNNQVLSNEGIVNRPVNNTAVLLEATFTKEGFTKVYEIILLVKGKDITYSVLLPQDNNGLVEVDKVSNIKAGESITITVTPNQGYEVEWLKVNNVEVGLNNGQAVYVVSSDVVITVSLKEIDNPNPDVDIYTVTFNSNGGTSVASQTVSEGGKITKPTDPTKTGYTFSGWYLSETEWDFNNAVTSNITLIAKWTENNVTETPTTYTVTVPSDANGFVSASKISGITSGEEVTITVTAKTGYELEWLKVNGVDTPVTDGQVIITVTSNINIVVSFVEKEQSGEDNKNEGSSTSTFTDKNLGVGSGELGYTASKSAYDYSSSRGLQFTQNNGEVTLTSNSSVENVTSVKLVVYTNNDSGMIISVKVGTITLYSGAYTEVLVTSSDGENYEVVFTAASVTGNIEITLTPKGTNKSMYLKSISIETGGAGGSGDTGSGELTTAQKIANIKNDISEVLSLANQLITETIEFPYVSLYDSIIMWNSSNYDAINPAANYVNLNLATQITVELGYQITLDGEEHDFEYFIVYIGGTGSSSSGGSNYNGTYYDNVDGMSGTALFNALRTLITSTHKKKTTYDELKTYLQEADEDPNNSSNMLLFYTGVSVKKTANMSVWNREHVWPKSLAWFYESGGGSDMHHMRPCNPNVNSSRGNTKFGESSGYYNAGNQGADYRGDAARIMLYLLTRYSESDNYSITSVFQSKEILLKWHEADPVSATEIHRNDYTYTIQGNRNPFIDNPNYVSLIWGTSSQALATNELYTGNMADKIIAFEEEFLGAQYF